MANKTRQYDDDDGRVIVDMDIEGMLWHDKRIKQEKSAVRKIGAGDQLTKSGARLYTWYAVLAGLLVVSVFSVTWVLFILFCINVWFR